MMQRYAEVIGDPVGHSKSPLIQKFWLERLGIIADYRAVHVGSDELSRYFEARRGDVNWLGCNVTLPHKSAVLEYLDRASDPVALIGASNCVCPARSSLVGFNTDVEGVLEPLTHLLAGFEPGDIATIIIGAGGAARAAAYALWQQGYSIDFVSRNQGSARKVADDIAKHRSREIGTHSFEEFERLWEAQRGRSAKKLVIVNASPLGMAGMPELSIDLDHVLTSTIIFDMVYAPIDTPLLKRARHRGLPTIDGLEMLVGQAAWAFEHFFGQPAPREHDTDLRALLTK